MVPSAEIRTYYDQPVIKAPVWTWEIPWYFFVGGLGGGSAVLACAAGLAGHSDVARAARRIATGAAAASPPLLIMDLGRPERFHHMLRVFKPTSPMSVGSWLLLAFTGAQGGATLLSELDRLPRLRMLADLVAAALGTGMATYTAVLFSDTAVPVWHEARHELPFVFAAGAAATAGAATTMATGDTGPAWRLLVGGAAAELGAAAVMKRRLGDLAEPYDLADAGRYDTAATALTAAGALLAGVGRRSRWARSIGAGLVLAGAACERWAVFRAGFISAKDPKYTVGPQRARADAAAAR